MSDDFRVTGRRGVAAARQALSVSHSTVDEVTTWTGDCPNCDLKPTFKTLLAYETWATHHHCEAK